MTEIRKILPACLVVAALGGFIWLVLRPPEPVYQGKPLSFWLEGYNPGYYFSHPGGPPPPAPGEADKAVRKIGTNAIPTLLGIFQERDSGFKVMMMRLLKKQLLIRIPLASLNRNVTAIAGFEALGPAAGNAVPRLIEIFDSDHFPFTQQGVPVILGHIGPTAAPAVPSLLRWITDTNGIVRNNAIFALRQIHSQPKLVVPALIKCLKDPDVFVRAQAARALAAYRKDAQPAVPALLELWRQEPPRPFGARMTPIDGTMVGSSWVPPSFAFSSMNTPDVGDLALRALQYIDPKVAAKADVK